MHTIGEAVSSIKGAVRYSRAQYCFIFSFFCRKAEDDAVTRLLEEVDDGGVCAKLRGKTDDILRDVFGSGRGETDVDAWWVEGSRSKLLEEGRWKDIAGPMDDEIVGAGDAALSWILGVEEGEIGELVKDERRELSEDQRERLVFVVGRLNRVDKGEGVVAGLVREGKRPDDEKMKLWIRQGTGKEDYLWALTCLEGAYETAEVGQRKALRLQGSRGSWVEHMARATGKV